MRDYEILRRALYDAWRGQYCSDCALNGLCQDDDSNCWFKQAADAIEELLAAVPRWISVEERLPETDDWVIVAILDERGDTPYQYTDFGWYLDAARCWIVNAEQRRDITHWMPLPEPPKEAE